MDPIIFSSSLKALRLAEYGSNLNSEIEPLCAVLEGVSAYISQLNATHNQPPTSPTDEIQRIELALNRVRTVAKKGARGVSQMDTESAGINTGRSSTGERWREIPYWEPRSRMRALLAMKHIGSGNAIAYARANATALKSQNGDDTFYTSPSPPIPQQSATSFYIQLGGHGSQSTIASYITAPSEPEGHGRSEAGNPNAGTPWQRLLEAEGLLLPPSREINWSGKGQHVEFAHASEVPLVVEKRLGSSTFALIESVICRRVRLARKSIRCPRQEMEEHLTEVKLLNQLHHPHIVQLVGTYILHKNFAILLYPAAEYTLDTYMERCYSGEAEGESEIMLSTLEKFPRCLVTAMNYIHSTNIAHMDIKPRNVLVRKMRNSEEEYRVYIADFGASYSYADTADAETDGPTSFTWRYCAPEVASQERRGASADTYSLGCVFAEIFTVLARETLKEFADARKDQLDTTSDDTTFHKNRDRVLVWITSLSWSHYDLAKMGTYRTTVPLLITEMLHDDPRARAGPEAIDEYLSMLGVTAHTCCSELPESYERVDDVPIGGDQIVPRERQTNSGEPSSDRFERLLASKLYSPYM